MYDKLQKLTYMKKSIYVVGNEPKDKFYEWFGDDFEKVKSIEDAGIVIFAGNLPLDPSTYGMKKVINFSASQKKDQRDIDMYKKVNPKEQIVLGISRGAHLACVMNGGKIIQGCDQNLHNGNQTHPIKGDNNWVYEIPSTHSQLMYPYNLKRDKYHMLYYCDPRGGYPSSELLRGTGMDGIEAQNNYEPEIVLFRGTAETPTALAIQGRPELIPGSPVSDMILDLIKDLIK